MFLKGDDTSLEDVFLVTVLLVFTRIAGVAGMEMRKSHILLALGASMRQACGAKSCLVSLKI